MHTINRGCLRPKEKVLRHILSTFLPIVGAGIDLEVVPA